MVSLHDSSTCGNDDCKGLESNGDGIHSRRHLTFACCILSRIPCLFIISLYYTSHAFFLYIMSPCDDTRLQFTLHMHYGHGEMDGALISLCIIYSDICSWQKWKSFLAIEVSSCVRDSCIMCDCCSLWWPAPRRTIFRVASQYGWVLLVRRCRSYNTLGP